MIKFFRKIRQKLLVENRFKKYLLYAVGEIILVVIGILIALQINNWNENIKEQQKVNMHLKNLASDIKGDIKQTEYRIKSLGNKTGHIDSLAEFFRTKKIEDLDNLDVFSRVYTYYGYRPFQWYRGAIDEIKSSGGLKLIKNDTLRSLITKYYAFTEHLDQDYQEDYDISMAVIRDMNKIINTNYPNRKDLTDTLYVSLRKKNKSIYLNSRAYREAKKLNLQLLTNDMNEIHSFINNLFNYKSALSIRRKGEFPRIIKGGKRILKMIEEEKNN
uniref:DUF6090 family protein n=1 Tax=uncultured Polaribacter sp. TaxID=174711 RepID=UPI00263A2247|nr:DUF6090 family protein [uncultured Polaribacter sp.]